MLFCMNEWIQAKLNKLESENDIFAKNGLESETNWQLFWKKSKQHIGGVYARQDWSKKTSWQNNLIWQNKGFAEYPQIAKKWVQSMKNRNFCAILSIFYWMDSSKTQLFRKWKWHFCLKLSWKWKIPNAISSHCNFPKVQWFHGWMLDYMDLDDISKHLKGRFKGAFPYISRSYFGRGAKKGLLVGFYYYFYY